MQKLAHTTPSRIFTKFIGQNYLYDNMTNNTKLFMSEAINFSLLVHVQTQACELFQWSELYVKARLCKHGIICKLAGSTNAAVLISIICITLVRMNTVSYRCSFLLILSYEPTDSTRSWYFIKLSFGMHPRFMYLRSGRDTSRTHLRHV